MFVDYQNFAGSFGHKFMGNYIVRRYITLLYVHWDVNSWIRVHVSHKSTNIEDSTACHTGF